MYHKQQRVDFGQPNSHKSHVLINYFQRNQSTFDLIIDCQFNTKCVQCVKLFEVPV